MTLILLCLLDLAYQWDCNFLACDGLFLNFVDPCLTKNNILIIVKFNATINSSITTRFDHSNEADNTYNLQCQVHQQQPNFGLLRAQSFLSNCWRWAGRQRSSQSSGCSQVRCGTLSSRTGRKWRPCTVPLTLPAAADLWDCIRGWRWTYLKHSLRLDEQKTTRVGFNSQV